MVEKELNTAQEEYCQLRASGYTKSGAYKIAYPNNNNPRQGAYDLESLEHIKERIMELKQERVEAFGLDVGEQIRRYNELYYMALKQGKLETAKHMLERIDAIGGFDAPKRSEVVRKGDSFKDQEGNLGKDIERFAKVLGKHSAENSKSEPQEDSQGVPKVVH